MERFEQILIDEAFHGATARYLETMIERFSPASAVALLAEATDEERELRDRFVQVFLEEFDLAGVEGSIALCGYLSDVVVQAEIQAGAVGTLVQVLARSAFDRVFYDDVLRLATRLETMGVIG
ncbi:hypothetical protein [Ferrimicrobium sp.]|uniref:hypothetical protein n=1 Tax=Ferrimicrobium sp. TaxID=2926050 RepID=UPI002606E19F|nr:hypothetical protein [Ferrimicrobium sp.]